MEESIKDKARIWWYKLDITEHFKLMRKYNCSCRPKEKIKMYSREHCYIKK